MAIVVTPIVLAALAKQGIDLGSESLDKIIDKTLESFNIDLSALGEFSL